MKSFWIKILPSLSLFALVFILFFAGERLNPAPKKSINTSIPEIPSEISFAGEKVPLEIYDVKERLDREVLVNTFWHSQTLVLLKKSKRYLDIIEPILKEEGVPDDFKYLCMAESGLANVVSPSNAAGFWQFLEGTAKQYGLEVNDEVDERYDLEKATRAACKYLKNSFDTLKSWALVAASYNMGLNGVMNSLRDQEVDSYYDLHLNTETSRYVFRLIAIKLIHKNPEEFHFTLKPSDYYPAYKTKSIEVDYEITSLAKFARLNGTNYKTLKILNPWLRKPYLKNKDKKVYKILLPA